MPLPTPHGDESQSDFMSRCMGDEAVQGDFDSHEQRIAVCMSQWADRGLTTTVNRITFLAPDAPDRPLTLPPLERRAVIPASSINAERRTVEVVWTSGERALVQRGFFSEPFFEELSLDTRHVKMSRLASGRAPVLAAHKGDSLTDTIGVVESATVDGTRGVATLRFAKGDPVADSVWNKIEQGILRNISVGYRVYKYEQRGKADETPILRAVDWEPHELSVVAMPVDASAHIRGDLAPSANPCLLVHSSGKEPTMADEPTVTAGPTLLDPKIPVVVPAPPEPEPQPTDLELGRRSEQERIQAILRGCEAARLPMSTAQDLIKRNVPLLEAQDFILESLRQRQTAIGGPSSQPSGVGTLDRRSPTVALTDQVPGIRFVGADPLENVWRGISNALLAKVAPAYFKLEDIGRPYQSRSALAFAELCLHHRGISTVGMTKGELAGAALGFSTRGSGFHTTSDFANILIDATNKVLRAAYLQAPQTFEPITRRMTVSDFKTMNLIQMGEAPTLLEVKEHGEFTRGTIGDARETLQLKTYGRVFSITRQALINDDLNAFGEVPAAFGRSARQKESDLVWAQITDNPTMGDGIALFDASAVPTGHANLASSSAAISVSTLGTGFAAMRVQKGVDNATYLNLVPRYLIAPVYQEGVARQYTATITPAQGSNVNPYAGLLQVITEPRLDADSTASWYLAASADDVPIIALAFLDGQDGPMVETRTGFEIDGIEIKCRHDVAAKVVDYRGLFKNAGA